MIDTQDGIIAPKAQEMRRERVARFTQALVSGEGQDLESVIRQFSLATGVSKRTLNEYWDVISNNNRGAVYEKRGIIRVRSIFKRYEK